MVCIAIEQIPNKSCLKEAYADDNVGDRTLESRCTTIWQTYVWCVRVSVMVKVKICGIVSCMGRSHILSCGLADVMLLAGWLWVGGGGGWDRCMYFKNKMHHTIQSLYTCNNFLCIYHLNSRRKCASAGRHDRFV